MDKVRTLIGWMMLIGFQHIVEQFIFGIDELYEMKKIFGGFNVSTDILLCKANAGDVEAILKHRGKMFAEMV